MSNPLVTIGCSGWEYADWRGRFYPERLPKRDWFPWYAQHFDTVEINSWFYRLPSVSTVERWAEKAPSGFTYAVKLGQFGSHRKKLRDPETWLANHLDRADRLGEALGPTLVQLPPRWKRNTNRLDEFLEMAGRRHRWAVELRDPSWLHDDTFQVLQRHGAALCIHDLLPDHPWELTTDWTYVRFHGPDAVDHPYRGRYTGRKLAAKAETLARWIDQGVHTFGYFNNDYDGFAPLDARWLCDRLARHVTNSRASSR